MTKWYNVADIHRDKHMRDKLSSYRSRIARSHAKFARHIDIPQPVAGRPTRITLVTQEGIAALYEPGETLPKLTPYPTPMRLTDKARAHIIEGGLFTTGGIERKARVLDREQFIQFLTKVGNEDLIEPDFINL